MADGRSQNPRDAEGAQEPGRGEVPKAEVPSEAESSDARTGDGIPFERLMDEDVGWLATAGLRVEQLVIQNITTGVYAEEARVAGDVVSEILDHHRLVVLRGPAGRGRGTMALHLLATAAADNVWSLDPDVGIRQLTDRQFQERCGHLLIVPSAQADGLIPYQMERLSELLRIKGSYLALVVDRRVRVPAEVTRRYAVECEAPAPEQVLRRHLDWHLGAEASRARDELARTTATGFGVFAGMAVGVPRAEASIPCGPSPDCRNYSSLFCNGSQCGTGGYYWTCSKENRGCSSAGNYCWYSGGKKCCDCVCSWCSPCSTVHCICYG